MFAPRLFALATVVRIAGGVETAFQGIAQGACLLEHAALSRRGERTK